MRDHNLNINHELATEENLKFKNLFGDKIVKLIEETFPIKAKNEQSTISKEDRDTLIQNLKKYLKRLIRIK